jgi:hypothetical protein
VASIGTGGLVTTLNKPVELLSRLYTGRRSKPREWTAAEDQLLSSAVAKHNAKNWKTIAQSVPNRNHVQCMQRWGKVLKPGTKRGMWEAEEDAKLTELVKGGVSTWKHIAALIEGRTSKQCRERWTHHLDPGLRRDPFDGDEDALIVEQQAKMGNRWSAIARMLPGRTDDAVKLRWYSLQNAKTPRRRARKGSKPPAAAAAAPAAAAVTAAYSAAAGAAADPASAAGTSHQPYILEAAAAAGAAAGTSCVGTAAAAPLSTSSFASSAGAASRGGSTRRVSIDPKAVAFAAQPLRAVPEAPSLAPRTVPPLPVQPGQPHRRGSSNPQRSPPSAHQAPPQPSQPVLLQPQPHQSLPERLMAWGMRLGRKASGMTSQAAQQQDHPGLPQPPQRPSLKKSQTWHSSNSEKDFRPTEETVVPPRKMPKTVQELLTKLSALQVEEFLHRGRRSFSTPQHRSTRASLLHSMGGSDNGIGGGGGGGGGGGPAGGPPARPAARPGSGSGSDASMDWNEIGELMLQAEGTDENFDDILDLLS